MSTDKCKSDFTWRSTKIPTALKAYVRFWHWREKTSLLTAMNFKCTNYVTCRSEELKQREYGRAILIPQWIKRSALFSLPLPVTHGTYFYPFERAWETITLFSFYIPLEKITERDLELLFETLSKVHSCQRLHHVTRNVGQNCSVRQALVRQYYNSNYLFPYNPTHFLNP